MDGGSTININHKDLQKIKMLFQMESLNERMTSDADSGVTQLEATLPLHCGKAKK